MKDIAIEKCGQLLGNTTQLNLKNNNYLEEQVHDKNII
jgi:hypothetical protein